MQFSWWIVTVLTVLAISVSAQSLGRNYGINLRLNQRGLDYATRIAVDEFYNEFRNKPIPDFSGSSGKTSYEVKNIRIPELSKPSFRLEVNRGQGVTARLSIARLKVTGSFRVRYKRGWIKLRKSGTFTTTAGSISLNAAFAVGRDSTGRPRTSIRSCNSRIGSFRVDIHASGILGWIINLLEGRISKTLKGKISPMLCDQVRKLNDQKLNPKLRQLKVSRVVQDLRLRLDYSLLRSPVFGSNYIDTTFKADVSWKGRTTGTPTATRTWPTVAGTENRMATIFITDYIMNALGSLLHRDGSLSYNVTKNMVSSKIRPRLALTCSGDFCAGTVLPRLAKKYPDGWLEAGIRTSSPPLLSLEDDIVRGNFSGTLEAYVNRPSGQRVRVAGVGAGLSIPLSLSIANNKLLARLGTPRVSIGTVDAMTEGLEQLLSLITTGFTNVELDKIGQRGIDLPTYDGVTFVRPQIFVKSQMIIVSTDVNYRP